MTDPARFTTRAEWLREALTERGETPSEASVRAGLARPVCARMLQHPDGARSPETIRKLAVAFNVDVQALADLEPVVLLDRRSTFWLGRTVTCRGCGKVADKPLCAIKRLHSFDEDTNTFRCVDCGKDARLAE